MNMSFPPPCFLAKARMGVNSGGNPDAVPAKAGNYKGIGFPFFILRSAAENGSRETLDSASPDRSRGQASAE